MKFAFALAVFAFVGLTGQSLADDVVSASGKAQQRKVMQECMKKEIAANSNMPKSDIQKKCEDEMKAQKDANDKTSGAPAR